jgi:hypothetical protein
MTLPESVGRYGAESLVGAVNSLGLAEDLHGGGEGGGRASGSAEVRVGAGEVVADLLAHAGVDVVLVQGSGLDEADAVGFVVDRGGAADGAADVGVLVLLAISPSL